MRSILTSFTLILSLICLSKSNKDYKNELKSNTISYKDTLITYDIQFVLRSLPDNGWFLKLNKDSTYEYIHWSGWGPNEGEILEKGEYNIKNKILVLKPKTKYKELKTRKFIFIEKGKNEVEDYKKIDCKESEGQIYCLSKK